MGGLELRRWTWSCLVSEGFAAIPLRTAERTRHATEKNEGEGADGAERTADNHHCPRQEFREMQTRPKRHTK